MSALDADVIVVGLGVMGSASLWRLAGGGRRVIGLEQFAAGHRYGSSHGRSRIIRTAYAEGERYVPLLLDAWRLWRELERDSGTELVTVTGALSLAPAGDPGLEQVVRAARRYGLDHTRLSAAQIRERFPHHRVTGDVEAVFEPLGGVIRPEATVTAALEVARSRGAEVRTGCTVQRIVPDARRPVVVVDGVELAARYVIVAAGRWVGRLVPAVADRVAPARRVQGWFRVAEPRLFAPEGSPVFIRTDGELSWYGVPSPGGGLVKVAMHGTPEPDEPVGPGREIRPADDADRAALRALAAGGLAGLEPDPVELMPCAYSMTPDEHFLVGQRSDLPGIGILAGFSGHGFKFAPVIGEIAARLALSGGTGADIGLFDPHRFDATS